MGRETGAAKCDRICRTLTPGRTPLVPHPVQLCGCCLVYKAVGQLVDVWLLLLLLLLGLMVVVMVMLLLLLMVRVVMVLEHSMRVGRMLQLLLGISHPY